MWRAKGGISHPHYTTSHVDRHRGKPAFVIIDTSSAQCKCSSTVPLRHQSEQIAPNNVEFGFRETPNEVILKYYAEEVLRSADKFSEQSAGVALHQRYHREQFSYLSQLSLCGTTFNLTPRSIGMFWSKPRFSPDLVPCAHSAVDQNKVAICVLVITLDCCYLIVWMTCCVNM